MPSSQPPPGKTIILTFDGTSKEFGEHNTNVVRLFSLLEKRQPWNQVVYYQPGIGTYLSRGSGVSSLARWYLKQVDRCLGWYLGAHIMDGYRFLMRNYRPGDTVCLFGFSRGGYIARCLAGMLNKVGLLINYNDQQIEFAYKRYLDTSENGEELARKFKKYFSIECEIQFLGVWETVSSIGLHNFGYLPYTSKNKAVKIFRQALALDEWRREYRPDFWFTVPEKTRERGTENGFVSIAENETNVLEVWFPGNHSDIGGGYYSDEWEGNTSNPSLVWMLNQILMTKVPIFFDTDAIKDSEQWLRAEIQPTKKKPRIDVLAGFQPVYSRFTAETPVRTSLNDEFRGNLAVLWWIIEVISCGWFPVRRIDGHLHLYRKG
ncbi:hypothetical protein M407DRAFT_25012 [Tulasnella calospora MUT 4182]|uniref:T6SS Phospholipase effector Tle1-like catalytic domain-containing protein n=1 Tax=Tulasnella calospora MUT 4182 TaxID=1051891 RepID=A0A0C3Q7M4_9AGAM|nr:hypothetical protein M407DRAFT_25012 [Tulasnella calospora MUT 4182]